MLWKAMKKKSLKLASLAKSREDRLFPEERRKEFREKRRKFEGRDVLADQVTSEPGVSDRGIEARRGDSRIPANKVMAHGYARVHSDIPKQREVARQYFKEVGEAQRKQSRPNLPKSELAKAPIAYHGSPNDFTEFDTKRTGSQHGDARGHGIYVSGKKEGATFYANARKDPTKGGLYRVDRPKDEFFLHWDLPISKQPKYVRDRIVNSPIYHSANERSKTGQFLSGDQLKGGEAYGGLQHYHDMTPEQVSAHLHSLGIKGIKYKHDDYHNYVIFHPKDAKIMSVQQTPKQKPKKIAASELEKALSPEELQNQGYRFKVFEGGRFGKDGAGIIAYHGKKRVGHLAFRSYPNTSSETSYEGYKRGYNPVYNANVSEEHRGKGLYQHMIRLAANHVKSKGSKGLMSEGYQRSGDATRAWDKIATHATDVKHRAVGEREPKRRADYFLAASELEKGARGDWKKEGYSFEHEPWNDDRSNYHPKTHDFYIRAKTKDGKTAGYASITHEGSRLIPAEISVKNQHQRKGIASAMYSLAEQLSGKKIYPSENQSDKAKKLWSQPKRSFGKSVKLEHYSPKKGLKEISPEHQGSGVDTSVYQNIKTSHPVSFFYRAGTEPEHIVAQGAKSKYSLELEPHHKVYDIGKDPENIRGTLRQNAMSRQINPGIVDKDDMHSAIKAAGYHGYFNSTHDSLPHVVAMYHAVPVKEEKDI